MNTPSVDTAPGDPRSVCPTCGCDIAPPLTTCAACAGSTRKFGASVKLRHALEYESVPAGEDPVLHVLVDVTPEGPSFLDPADGPVAHVILLLDVSASMNEGEKYPVLREALTRMLEKLRAPGAAPVLLSIVIFAYGAKTLFDGVPAAALTPDEVLHAIESSPFRFGRYTDIAGALKRAGKIAVDQLRAQRAMPVRICILTDGRAQDLERTRHVWNRVGALPVDVDCLAFGDDADDAMLQELVSGGRGGTVKQVRLDTLADAFDWIGTTSQRIVSNRAIVDLALAPGVVGRRAYRYRPGRHSYGDDAFVGGVRFRTDIGTLESGRTYSMLFEVRVPVSTSAGEFDDTDLSDALTLETDDAVTPIGRISVRLRGIEIPRIYTADLSVRRSLGRDLPERDAAVVAAHDVLASLDGTDAAVQLRALRARLALYVAEHRDPRLIELVEHAIAVLEKEGSLATLTSSQQASLRAHTVTLRRVGAEPGE